MATRKKTTKRARTLTPVDDLLDAACEYAAAIYSEDPTVPGFQIARLGPDSYYVALHRYGQAYGKDRTVALKITAPTLREAVKGMVDLLLEKVRAYEKLARVRSGFTAQ